jgi:hypothetical protein
MLNLSALFLSQKRLDEVLNRELLPFAYRSFILADPRNSGLERRSVLSAYEDAAITWLTRAKFPTLGELAADSRLAPGTFFTHIGPFMGKGISDAALRFHTGRALQREAVLWTKLDGFREGLTLTIQAHPENYTTASAPGEMSGKKRLFLVGRITDCETNNMRAQTYIIGHLHEEERKGAPSVDHFGRLPWQMEVFPLLIDNFAALETQRMPSPAELNRLLTIPESEIKASFAAIIGEPSSPRTGEERSRISSLRRCASTEKQFQQPSLSRVRQKQSR